MFLRQHITDKKYRYLQQHFSAALAKSVRSQDGDLHISIQDFAERKLFCNDINRLLVIQETDKKVNFQSGNSIVKLSGSYVAGLDRFIQAQVINPIQSINLSSKL